jgi:hypothetical protein
MCGQRRDKGLILAIEERASDFALVYKEKRLFLVGFAPRSIHTESLRPYHERYSISSLYLELVERADPRIKNNTMLLGYSLNA